MALNFGASIAANCEKLKRKVNDQCLHIAKELFLKVVEGSPSPLNPGPYADGLLVNQWYPAIGGVSGSVGSDTSPYGAGSIARIHALFSGSTEFYSKDGMISLSNNVHYAGLAESIGWQPPRWNGRPGYFMVLKALQDVSMRFSAGYTYGGIK